jgi:hypothetical protein
MAIMTLLIFIGVIVAIGISSFCGHTLMWGDPNTMWGLGILLLLYSFNLWKNKKELFWRCALALPFALLTTLLLKVTGFKTVISCVSGLLLFYALIIEVKNLRLHYVITLTSAIILFFLAVLFKGVIPSFRNIYVVWGCAFAVLAFYESYEARLSHSQKAPVLWPIAVKSVKFTVACFFALVLLTVSHILCRRYHLGFAVSFTIAVLIALSFLVACKLFNIKNPAFSDVPERRVEKKKQELLDKINKD